MFSMIEKLHHVGYLVRNIEKSKLAFEKLGLKSKGNLFYDEDRKAYICFIEGGEESH